MAKNKSYEAVLDISFSISQDQIKNDKYLGRFFKDRDNPTEDELRAYFDTCLDNYAGSNDGSELLANASYDIITHEADETPEADADE